MLRQSCPVIVIAMGVLGCVFQAAPLAAQDAKPTEASPAWRRAATSASSQTATTEQRATPAAFNAASASRSASASPTDSLPNDAGQVWRDYDITAYTARVTSAKQPEQAVVDWILRETGYEKWHTDPISVLSVNSHALRVYQTPEMQKTVADIVARFTNSEAATYTFSMRVITLDSPSWRTSAQRLLRPVPVQTSGVNAWVLPRENAAILFGELRRRGDFRQHNSPYLMVNNGQTTVVSTMQGRVYTKDAVANASATEGYILTKGQVDEGLSLEFSPLLSFDRRMVDAAIKCNIDQVEKMLQTYIDVPVQNRPLQRVNLEVPQMSHYRFHERFRWPIDQVLVLGLGMVALPVPIDGAPLMPGVPLPLAGAPARADLLLFIECKGQLVNSVNEADKRREREPHSYRGRY
jgi:hypothetical protein